MHHHGNRQHDQGDHGERRQRDAEHHQRDQAPLLILPLEAGEIETVFRRDRAFDHIRAPARDKCIDTQY
ncbi:hypothetical protein D3C86_1846220 [compost metagenome]